MGLDSYPGYRGKGCTGRSHWFYFILYFSPREMNDEIDNMRNACKEHGLTISLAEDFPVHVQVDELSENV